MSATLTETVREAVDAMVCPSWCTLTADEHLEDLAGDGLEPVHSCQLWNTAAGSVFLERTTRVDGTPVGPGVVQCEVLPSQLSAEQARDLAAALRSAADLTTVLQVD